MSFLLDTDICSAHFRRPAGLAHRFLQHAGLLSVSAISPAEAYGGAYHRPEPRPLLDKIGELLWDVSVIDFDSCAPPPLERFAASYCGKVFRCRRLTY
jgi:predicted nucleic acid-binding protein